MNVKSLMACHSNFSGCSNPLHSESLIKVNMEVRYTFLMAAVNKSSFLSRDDFFLIQDYGKAICKQNLCFICFFSSLMLGLMET